MTDKILRYSNSFDDAKEKRRRSVERCLAILLTATEGPNEMFMDALEEYIEGRISLSEMEKRVDRLEYIEKEPDAID